MQKCINFENPENIRVYFINNNLCETKNIILNNFEKLFLILSRDFFWYNVSFLQYI